jgi:hypothetical protein
MAWLSPEERESLTRPERRALRQRRKLERWPETGGRPPWLVRAEGVLVRVAQRATIVLIRASVAAVKAAAVAVLSGGRARHEFAVSALLAAASEVAIELAREDAAGLIEDTYEILYDDGVIE